MSSRRKASAAAAQESMARAGFNRSTFVGFDAFTDNHAQTNNNTQKHHKPANVSSFYDGDNDEIKAMFKKLAKRDSLTKVKALQEFQDMLDTNSLPKEAIRKASGHFYFLYLRMCSRSTDPRVREKANAVLGSFCNSVPKACTKSASCILGELLCSMGDTTNADVARAAKITLETFINQGEKHDIQVLVNLNGGLGAFMRERVELKDGDEESIERLQCSALNTIIKCSTLPWFSGEFVESIIDDIFEPNPLAMWKIIFEGKLPSVRAKGFEMAAAMAKYKKAGMLGKDFAILFTKCLRKEKDQHCLSYLFEGIICTINLQTGPVFFSHVGDYRKLFFPALWDVLRNGARGAGSSVYPLMLPLMSLVPEDVWAAYGQGVLASKWLEELWDGLESEHLGPHHAPYLVESELECVAFLSKKGRTFPPHILLNPVSYFICEARRFRLGNDVPKKVTLALSQIKDDSPIWPELETALCEYFTQDVSTAERVAEIFNASKLISNVNKVAMGLFLRVYQNPKNSPSMSALDIVYCLALRAGMERSMYAQETLYQVISGQSSQQEARTRIMIRLILQGASVSWDQFIESTATSPVVVARAVQYIFDTKELVHRVPCVREFLLGSSAVNHEIFTTLLKVGWVDENDQSSIQSRCIKIVDKALQDAFFLPPSSGSVVHVGTLAETLLILETLAVSPVQVLGRMHILRQGFSIKSNTAVSDCPEVIEYVKEWVVTWFDTVAWNIGQGWTTPQKEFASRGWARIVVKFQLNEQTFLSLSSKPTIQNERLVLCAMHVSEELEDGECLGFHEPASLLWQLLKFSNHPEEFLNWRHAVLLPYIAFQEERLSQVVQVGLVAKELVVNGSGADLLRCACAHGTISVCLRGVLHPRLLAMDLTTNELKVIIDTCSEELSRADLLTPLSVAYANRIMDCAKPETCREAEDVANDFMGLLDSHQDETIHTPSPEPGDDQALASGRVTPPTPPPSPANIPTELFSMGEAVYYVKNDRRDKGIVSGVHLDDPTAPYYTIRLDVDNREIQTTSNYLEPLKARPKSLAELNKLLAVARRRGDHKESLRLMKLQPSLVPKPVDSDDVKRETIRAARKKRQEALERIASEKRRERAVSGGNESSMKDSGTDDVVGRTETNVQDLGVYIEQFACIVSPDRASKLEEPELRVVLKIGSVLATVVSPRAIGTFLRHYDPKSTFRQTLIGTLQVLDAILSQIPSDAVPDGILSFLERTVLSCMYVQDSPMDPGIVLATTKILLWLPDDEPVMERALGSLLDIIIQKKLDLTSEMVTLISRVPVQSVLSLETEKPKKLMETILFDSSDELFWSWILLFERCTEKSDTLVRSWWGQKELIYRKIDSSFNPLAWCMLVFLVRRIRLIEPDIRDDITSELEENGLVQAALRWSLLQKGDVVTKKEQLVAVNTLRTLPMLSRKWYTDGSKVNRADFSLIKARLTRYITPVIVKREIREINRASRKLAFDIPVPSGSGTGGEEDVDVGKITVTPRAASRTVTVLYEKDDCNVEMQMTLPGTYPMQNVDVECTRQFGIKKDRWRRWVLQINRLLSTQDGTLLDAITLWKCNMDREFQGLEPCPICYTVLHVGDHSLPNIQCSTCKNKFHSTCIAKWFRTSHKNECPLCKQPF
mmetsp:Transcript_21384/g.46620  ORF Transcript_21384/g.46620 Transcript_21384/m.46620 type:complete len:1635 (-) Transcript_21384:5604-10508(-)